MGQWLFLVRVAEQLRFPFHIFLGRLWQILKKTNGESKKCIGIFWLRLPNAGTNIPYEWKGNCKFKSSKVFSSFLFNEKNMKSV